jgi:hypothetical protein
MDRRPALDGPHPHAAPVRHELELPLGYGVVDFPHP